MLNMRPDQGQGCGQAVEDAEALGAMFEDVKSHLSTAEAAQRLQQVFEGRLERASTIQGYSRQQAMAPKSVDGEIKLNGQQFSAVSLTI